MDLMLLEPIARSPEQYIRHIHLTYLHTHLERLPEPYEYYYAQVVQQPIPLEYVTALVPFTIKQVVQIAWGVSSNTHISYFINAHYLKLLPEPGAAEPLDVTFRRWPVSHDTEKTLKNKAMYEDKTITEYVTTIPLPAIHQHSPVMLPQRHVTSYIPLKTDLETLRRLAAFYDAVPLIAPQNPRTLVSKAGHVLDYILSTS